MAERQFFIGNTLGDCLDHLKKVEEKGAEVGVPVFYELEDGGREVTYGHGSEPRDR
ncbi:hypothetical protein [Actinoallomurus sp. NPDC052274]|uniref:hypothetical protein n=1 Tax=Actinoallomurus sp. NPDC052274 TaxID=3155420 RepID=UPI00342ED203